MMYLNLGKDILSCTPNQFNINLAIVFYRLGKINESISILNNILGFDFPKNTTKLDIISILADLYQRHKLDPQNDFQLIFIYGFLEMLKRTRRFMSENLTCLCIRRPLFQELETIFQAKIVHFKFYISIESIYECAKMV